MESSKPELKYKDEFMAALKNLCVSDQARQLLAGTDLMVMTGISGAGRNTIATKLVQTGEFEFIVSDTTRPPKLRDGRMEEDGVAYHFRDEREMLNDIIAGEFIEAELIHEQQVSGTSIRAIVKASESGRMPIGELEYQGINAIAKAAPHAVVIAVFPPSYNAWLARLQQREEMSEEELMSRLKTAMLVIDNTISHPEYHIVINDDLDRCIHEIQSICVTGKQNFAERDKNAKIAQSMQGAIQQRLAQHAA